MLRVRDDFFVEFRDYFIKCRVYSKFCRDYFIKVREKQMEQSFSIFPTVLSIILFETRMKSRFTSAESTFLMPLNIEEIYLKQHMPNLNFK